MYWSLVVKYCYMVVDSQYCCSTPGPVNPAGDTLRSIADSLGLSGVLRYLESLGSDLKGESVLLVSCCDDVMLIGIFPQPIVITVRTTAFMFVVHCLATNV